MFGEWGWPDNFQHPLLTLFVTISLSTFFFLFFAWKIETWKFFYLFIFVFKLLMFLFYFLNLILLINYFIFSFLSLFLFRRIFSSFLIVLKTFYSNSYRLDLSTPSRPTSISSICFLSSLVYLSTTAFLFSFLVEVYFMD